MTLSCPPIGGWVCLAAIISYKKVTFHTSIRAIVILSEYQHSLKYLVNLELKKFVTRSSSSPLPPSPSHSLLTNASSFGEVYIHTLPDYLTQRVCLLKNDPPFLLQICPKLCYFIHEYACLKAESSVIAEKLAKNSNDISNS